MQHSTHMSAHMSTHMSIHMSIGAVRRRRCLIAFAAADARPTREAAQADSRSAACVCACVRVCGCVDVCGWQAKATRATMCWPCSTSTPKATVNHSLARSVTGSLARSLTHACDANAVRVHEIVISMRGPSRVCTHARMHAHTHARTHTCMHTCMHTCTGRWPWGTGGF